MMNIKREQIAPNIVLLRLDGRLRLGEEESRLREAVHNELALGPKIPLLDFGEVRSIDSSGIDASIWCLTTSRKRSCRLILFGLRSYEETLERNAPLDVLTLTKLLSVFETYNTEEGALAALAGK